MADTRKLGLMRKGSTYSLPISNAFIINESPQVTSANNLCNKFENSFVIIFLKHKVPQ